MHWNDCGSGRHRFLAWRPEDFSTLSSISNTDTACIFHVWWSMWRQLHFAWRYYREGLTSRSGLRKVDQDPDLNPKLLTSRYCLDSGIDFENLEKWDLDLDLDFQKIDLDLHSENLVKLYLQSRHLNLSSENLKIWSVSQLNTNNLEKDITC